jgi:hypothetical protein
MKKLTGVVIFSISFCIFVNGQMKNADAVVKELFEILKTKDSTRYMKLFPNYEKMKKFMKQTFALSPRRAEMDSMMDIFTEEQYREQVLARGTEKFSNFLKIGERKEVVWNNIMFKRYEVDTSSSENDEFNDPGANIKKMKGGFDFMSGQKEYTVKFDQAVWFASDSNWYGVELINLYEKGKEIQGNFEMPDNRIIAPDNLGVSITAAADTIKVDEHKTVKSKKVPIKKIPAKKPAVKSAALKPKQ